MNARYDSGSCPAIYICLGHQGIAETLRYHLHELCKNQSNYYNSLRKTSEKTAEKFLELLEKIQKIGKNIEIRKNEKTTIKGFDDPFFAVTKNELPETGLKRIQKYEPLDKNIPAEIIDYYTTLSRFQTGAIEDYLHIGQLDTIMLHNDEVNEEAVLFMNWVLQLLDNFYTENIDIIENKEKIMQQLALPFGLEIAGSTHYQQGEKSDEDLTEIAGLNIYYHDKKTHTVRRDFSIQFHPELLDEARILQKKDLENRTILELPDSLQILLAIIQAGYLETHK